MFKRLLSSLAESASSIATKYALRISVVVPFVIAFAYGIAGLTVYLSDLFGYRDAYFIMAAGFAVLGGVAALAVRLSERKEEEAEASSQVTGTSVAATAAKVAVSVPAAIVQTARQPGTGTGWSDALMGWPLLMAAIGLLLVSSSGRRTNRHLYS